MVFLRFNDKNHLPEAELGNCRKFKTNLFILELTWKKMCKHIKNTVFVLQL